MEFTTNAGGKMFKVEITQKNWDGNGNDRIFTSHPINEYQLSNKLRSIVNAYHLPSTEIRVNGELIDPSS
jgi:hypothetical protein